MNHSFSNNLDLATVFFAKFVLEPWWTFYISSTGRHLNLKSIGVQPSRKARKLPVVSKDGLLENPPFLDDSVPNTPC